MPVRYLFPTPIYVDHIIIDDQIDKEIERYIQTLNDVDLINQWNDNVKTTFKYAKTNNTLEFLPTLKNIITTRCNDFLKQLETNKFAKFLYHTEIFDSWLNISAENNFQHFHVHGYSDMSGVFYYQTNSKDGDISFNNPSLVNRVHKMTMYRSNINIPPEKGKLIIFPGFLEHAVNINKTEHTRVSISFNATLKEVAVAEK